MWVLRLKIKHDCTIGNRCRKFKCVGFSLPLSSWKEKKGYYISQRHTIEGDKDKVNKFIQDLKKDKRIINVEISQNTIFFVEKRKGREIPAAHYNPKMFFVQPVFVDKQGYEYWELASWQKQVLMEFRKRLEKSKAMHILKIEKFRNEKLNTIYFPKIMPHLSEKQQEAYRLAVEFGYYSFPRHVDLGDLAREMKVTVSTFQEHLRRAEAKIMPKYV